MNSKTKIYRGENYSFKRVNNINSGGNGAIYTIDCKINEREVVAKFFNYDGNDKDKRYQRFKYEVNTLKELKDIDGIMTVLDYHLPDETPQNNDEAWFLMYKADTYNVKFRKKLTKKIEEMLRLAIILKNVHELGYTHRDIKPNNILYIKGKIYLTDFGLVWNENSERITGGERLGPYDIMPPEFEEENENLRTDYKLSDVYLFAKVLWMTLKNDNRGFQGQYDRKNSTIYLKREQYNTYTLEPIHKLIEGATYDEINKRISLDECISLLKLQKDIEEGNVQKEEIKKLQSEEEYEEVINSVEPDEFAYVDINKIDKIVEGIIKDKEVCIINFEEEINIKIESGFQIKKESNNLYAIILFRNRRIATKYIFNISEIIRKKNSKTLIIKLNDLNKIEENYISVGESLKELGKCDKIYLTENEQIVVEC